MKEAAEEVTKSMLGIREDETIKSGDDRSWIFVSITFYFYSFSLFHTICIHRSSQFLCCAWASIIAPKCHSLTLALHQTQLSSFSDKAYNLGGYWLITVRTVRNRHHVDLPSRKILQSLFNWASDSSLGISRRVAPWKCGWAWQITDY